MVNEKSVELKVKLSGRKMRFEIRTGNVVAGVNNDICRFCIDFQDYSQETAERKITLTLVFNDNWMIENISAQELKEKS
jgi:hypothetical protein